MLQEYKTNKKYQSLSAFFLSVRYPALNRQQLHRQSQQTKQHSQSHDNDQGSSRALLHFGQGRDFTPSHFPRSARNPANRLGETNLS